MSRNRSIPCYIRNSFFANLECVEFAIDTAWRGICFVDFAGEERMPSVYFFA